MIGRTNASGSLSMAKRRFVGWLMNENYEQVCRMTHGSYRLRDSGNGVWKFNNINVNSSTANTKMDFYFNCIVTVEYDISLELNFDFLTVNAYRNTTEKIVERTSGIKSGSVTFEMSVGDTLEFILEKDIDQSRVTNESNIANIRIYVEEKR